MIRSPSSRDKTSMEDSFPGGFARSEYGSLSRGVRDDLNQRMRNLQIPGFQNVAGNMATNVPPVHAVDGTYCPVDRRPGGPPSRGVAWLLASGPRSPQLGRAPGGRDRVGSGAAVGI